MSWTKEADWLPVSNAYAQVKFWRNDLKLAFEFMEWAISMKDKGFNADSAIDEAQKDIQESTTGLEKAQKKLRETLKRVNAD